MSDNNPRPSGWLGPWCLLVGVILLVTGLFFAIGGFKLVSLGGVGIFSSPGLSLYSLRFSSSAASPLPWGCLPWCFLAP